MEMQHHLKSQFKALLKNNQWDQYIDLLCNEGLFWWLNLDALQIANHLSPLNESPPMVQKPDRLDLLYKTLNPKTSQNELTLLYHRFLNQRDYLAAVACIIAGWSNVWNSGIDLRQMDNWVDEIRKIKKTNVRLSAIEQAAVLTALGSIDLIRWGKIKKAEKTLQQALMIAERAKAFSLKIYIAYIYGHSLIWQGDLKKIEVLDFDIAPLCLNEDVALIPVVAYQTMKSFYYLLAGEVAQSKAVLNKITEHDLFDFFPMSIWLLAYGNLLLANAYEGNDSEVHRISMIIQNRAVPEQSNFHHGYAHFSLATASLVDGDLYKAKLHCIEAIKRSRLCNAPIVERVCALLMGQILIDSGEYRKAELHLTKWVGDLSAAGNLLLAGQAALELADLFCQTGKRNSAQKYYEKASDLLPQFESIPNPHRGAAFTGNLKQKIFRNNKASRRFIVRGTPAIKISTFGHLKLQTGNQVINDSGRSNLALSMLKAILACGGSQVSTNWLMDALWPNLEGDRVYGSFKVTLFRLRRIVSGPTQAPPPWITLKNKKVSIAKSLCFVDSIIFQDKIKTSENEISDIHEQTAALELYRADFLKEDDGYPWIVHHRNKLRQMYMDGVIALAEHCFNANNLAPMLPSLRQALEFDELNEKIYALLMKTYLRMGLPSQALETYNIAETTLFQNFNIQPGRLLSDLKKEALRS